MLDKDTFDLVVAKVLAELGRAGGDGPGGGTGAAAVAPPPSGSAIAGGTGAPGDLVIDLPDPTVEEARRTIRVDNPYDAEGLRNLCATTNARLAFGHTGTRPLTAPLLLFQADHAVTQDAIYGTVPEALKERFGLLQLRTRVEDRESYLLRPDLGRLLADESKQVLAERAQKSPDVQVVVGDGLSAAAIENNLEQIYPVIEQGLKSAGISVGTPLFVENCRVGVMNDINAVVKAKAVLLLIGERPGLGIADAMSAYMGYDPQPGKSDADRDLICMITNHGGTNPLEAGAYVVEFLRKMLTHKASGVRLREVAGA